MVGQLVNWVGFREITKSSTVDPIGNYDVSLTLISKKTFLVKILGHTFDPLNFIFIVLLLSEFNGGLPHNGHGTPKKARRR